jgi:uncharacterized protein YlzI (FlbEa/FlbD family)
MYGIRNVEKRSKISFMAHFHEFPSFIIIFSFFHEYWREISRPDLTDTLSNGKKVIKMTVIKEKAGSILKSIRLLVEKGKLILIG